MHISYFWTQLIHATKDKKVVINAGLYGNLTSPSEKSGRWLLPVSFGMLGQKGITNIFCWVFNSHLYSQGRCI
ncbi:hypothetical protein RND71_013816 [Anisodus tanguticus]|uniref:Uncharacterized protein n=1 Tax=Anisodus tanguticus TaxID=243964 RepID=A0AAE1VJD1_9SOLA|nr:hypothetical protein RND71_013816 [Anisodus tanguticus]